MTLNEISSVLAARQPRIASESDRRQGAVAMLLRDAAAAPQMLFIERATCPGDPWSGDLGFPGGKMEPEDAHLREAAEREVLEEIGLSLAGSRFLGRLDDITGDRLPIVVACFVYALGDTPTLTLADEVVNAFWVPLTDLLDPERQVETTVRFGNEPLVRPAIRLLPPGRRVLWGLTYRLVQQFLGLLGHQIGTAGLPTFHFPSRER